MARKKDQQIKSLLEMYQWRLTQISWTQKDHQSAVDLHLINASSAMLLVDAAIRDAYIQGYTTGVGTGFALNKQPVSETYPVSIE